MFAVCYLQPGAESGLSNNAPKVFNVFVRVLQRFCMEMNLSVKQCMSFFA